jgi:hypothetical protein
MCLLLPLASLLILGAAWSALGMEVSAVSAPMQSEESRGDLFSL